MAVEGHDFSLKGILMGVAFCVAAHIIMVPTGLEGFAHEIGDGISEFFNGAADPSAIAADPTAGTDAMADASDPHAGHDHSHDGPRHFGPSLHNH